MQQKHTLWLLAFFIASVSSLGDVQSQSNIPILGYLGAGPGGSFRGPALWRELNKLGYIEGKNIGSEIRSADNKPERLAPLAGELVRLKVDVIYTGGTSAARAAKDAT